MGPLANFKPNKGQVKVPQLKWIDDVEKNRKNINPKEALKVNDFANDLLRKKNISKVENHVKIESDTVTRALRSRTFTLSQITGVKDIEKNGQNIEGYVPSSNKNSPGKLKDKSNEKRPLATPDLFYNKE